MQVVLVFAGLRKRVKRSSKTRAEVAGKLVALSVLSKQVKGELTMIVDERAFEIESTSTPVGIVGLAPAPWPASLAFASAPLINTLEELAHFMRLGETNPVTFEWWRAKFRPRTKRESAQRSWERLKQKLRNLGVPATSETLPDGECETEIVLRFNKPEFIRGVQVELARRDRARGRTV